MRSFTLCFLLALCCLAVAEIQVKHRAGPPSEFIGGPIDTADYSDVQHSAFIKVASLVPDPKEAGVLVQTVPLVVDSKNEFRFVFFSPHSSFIELTLSNPSGERVPIEGVESGLPIGDQHVPGVVYTIKDPIQGEYQLQLRASRLNEEQSLLLTSSTAGAYIIVWNEDAHAIHTTVNTYATLTGRKVGLVSRIIDNSRSYATGTVPQAVKGNEQSAVMSVELPDGDTLHLSMEEGRQQRSSDGTFEALITPSVAGKYIFQATIRGINGDGIKYTRSTLHAVTVIDPTLSLTGSAKGVIHSEQSHRLVANIEVEAPIGNQYHAYAEVWGKDDSGDDVPVSWIGGMTHVQLNGRTSSVPLELDLNWVSMAGAKGPLLLRSVVISDSGHFIPVAEYDEIPIETTFVLEAVMSTRSLRGDKDAITDEMRMGIRPAITLSAGHEKRTVTPWLVLSHGYCASSNPWLNQSNSWSNPKYYLDPSAPTSRPIDSFAQSVLNWANSNGLQAWSYIGHSQGGMVGVHIFEYYWSGLDYITGGRKIQSVGTPYQGTTIAGYAASLGSIFGIGCGTNYDLTRAGAAAWLQYISRNTTKETYFYTTTYVQGLFWGDYCSLVANAILEWPNDGITEFDYASLPGANNMGNTQGQCHTADMKYMAQYNDMGRNSIMNGAAAKTPTI